jgi:hypothetical protein
MKVLFVIRTIAHISYHETTLLTLVEKGHSVDIVHDEEISRAWPQDKFKHFLSTSPLFSASLLIKRKNIWHKILNASRELRTYANYILRKDQDEFYRKRWERVIPRAVKFFSSRSDCVRKIIALKMSRNLFDWIENISPPDPRIVLSIKEKKPDVVIASPANMRFSDEVDYLKVAKALGIPTVVPVLSWDNLTTKGLFHVIPDLLLVWNRTQQTEAVQIHQVSPENIVVTGSPFLDKWFMSPPMSLSKDDFGTAVGLEKGQHYILYLGSSTNIAKDESSLVRGIADALLNAKEEKLKNIKILFRPHGANQKIYADFKHPRVILWSRELQLPETTDGFADFYFSIKYAVCALGLNTTAMVDAILADCPVVALLVNEYSNTNASQAVHYKYILDADVYEKVTSVNEAFKAVVRLCKQQDSKNEQRRKFALNFVRPNGFEKTAGENAANAIISLV